MFLRELLGYRQVVRHRKFIFIQRISELVDTTGFDPVEEGSIPSSAAVTLLNIFLALTGSNPVSPARDNFSDILVSKVICDSFLKITPRVFLLWGLSFSILYDKLNKEE